MKRRVLLEKNVGETPLEALSAWRQLNPTYASTPASYAGRLDPMASGKLLLLLGDECKKQKRYTGLDKEYEIEVLLDAATDTGDVLGLPTYAGVETQGDDSQLSKALAAVHGAHLVPYPAFSSKTVNGKPLFLHTLEGGLDAITIPTHEETIYRITLLDTQEVSKTVIQERISNLLAFAPRSDEPSKKLGADFRQDEIRMAWQSLFNAIPSRSFTILRLRVTCASGTYMRTLAARIGKELGTGALALSIHRTRIGRYIPLPFTRGLWRSVR